MRVVSGLRPPTVLAIAALLAVPVASQAADSGELVRLRQDMQTRVQKNQWSGADRAFRKLKAVAAEGAGVLTIADWKVGAQIARNLGDMASVQERLQEAFDLEPSDDLRAELQQIGAAYGPVVIEIAGGFSGEIALKATPPPFEPDKRAFIDKASERLAAGRRFEGLIPIGRYSVAGTPIEVTTGAIDTLRVQIAADGSASLDRVRPGGASEAPGLEWHVGLGLGFGATTAASSGVQPTPFSGLGLRVGGGLDAWIAPTVGVRVQLGYQGLFAGGGSTLDDGTDLPGSQIHQGYVWLGGAWRTGPLDIAVGPQFGLGAERASCLDGAAWSDDCADRPEDASCRGIGVATEEDLANTALTGSLLTIGGTAGATWDLLPDADVRPVIGLEGGALSDGRRLYPWASLTAAVRL